jgi:hypothetical protein
MLPNERTIVDERIEALRAMLDPATFSSAWAEGGAMTLNEAITDALRGDSG